jgi:hypothetical protein
MHTRHARHARMCEHVRKRVRVPHSTAVLVVVLPCCHSEDSLC